MTTKHTGWLKHENLLFAHWFDWVRSICGSAQVVSARAATEADHRCEDCVALTARGEPAHEHDWHEVTTFGDDPREQKMLCWCGERKTERLSDAEVERRHQRR